MTTIKNKPFAEKATASTFTAQVEYTGVTKFWNEMHIDGYAKLKNYNNNQATVVSGGDAQFILNTPIPTVWRDLLAFGRIATPTYQVSANGTTWTATTLNKQLFDQKDHFAQNVITYPETKAVRWTWNSSSLAWSRGTWLAISYSYLPNNPNKKVTFESSTDGVTWVIRHESVSNVMEQMLYHYVEFYADATYLRLTISYEGANSGDVINIAGIRLLTYSAGGAGFDNQLPYSWDENRKMTVENLDVTNGLRIQGGNGLQQVALAPDGTIALAAKNVISFRSPIVGENQTLFYVSKNTTLTRVSSVIRGVSPSATWNIRFAGTRNAAWTNVFTIDKVTTNAAGDTTTTLNNVNIPANSWVWLVTTDVSGTIDEFTVIIDYI